MRLTGKTCDKCKQATYETYAVTAYSGIPAVANHYCNRCWYGDSGNKTARIIKVAKAKGLKVRTLRCE